MENSFQTSFIPKKPINSNENVVISHNPMNFLTVTALLILIITFMIAVGFFFYKKYLITQTENISSSLKTVRTKFEKDTIRDLEAFDNRVIASKTILDGHLVLSPLFYLLGSMTIPSIQYTKFNHQASLGNLFTVKMSGIARDYKSIAIQSDVFNTENGHFFKNVVFSNLTKDKDGHVNFDIEFTVDPTLISYSEDSKKEQQSNITNTQNIVPDTNQIQPVPTTNNVINPQQ